MRSTCYAVSRFVVSGALLLVPFCGLALAASEQGTQNDTLAAPSGLIMTAAPIKGDRSTAQYHLPGCPEYDSLDEATVVIFASEEEAQRAGYHKAETCS